MENFIYVNFQYEVRCPRHQIFKEIGKEVYYGRDHFLLWHTIYTENNQMTLEMVIPNEVTFIICDDNIQKICTSSNKKNEPNFPLLRYQCLFEWTKLKKKFNTIYEYDFYSLLKGKNSPSLEKMLLPIKIEYENDNPLLTYDEKEWIDNCENLMTEPEILHTFDYCGTNVHIHRILRQHRICKMKWLEYYAGQEFVGIQIVS